MWATRRQEKKIAAMGHSILFVFVNDNFGSVSSGSDAFRILLQLFLIGLGVFDFELAPVFPIFDSANRQPFKVGFAVLVVLFVVFATSFIHTEIMILWSIQLTNIFVNTSKPRMFISS